MLTTYQDLIIQVKNKQIPNHVALMMDGNRSWARAHHLPIHAGHLRGASIVSQTIEIASELGIKNLTFFAFSTENWARSSEEVQDLFRLMSEQLKIHTQKAIEQDIILSFIGDIEALPLDLKQQIKASEAQTRACQGIRVIFAINYGARSELVRSFKKIGARLVAGELEPDQIREWHISEALDTSLYGDPQLLIRTGGQVRLSNFLLWQLAYTELYFCSDPWPSFTPTHFLEAIAAYQSRQRRFGV